MSYSWFWVGTQVKIKPSWELEVSAMAGPWDKVKTLVKWCTTTRHKRAKRLRIRLEIENRFSGTFTGNGIFFISFSDART